MDPDLRAVGPRRAIRLWVRTSSTDIPAWRKAVGEFLISVGIGDQGIDGTEVANVGKCHPA